MASAIFAAAIVANLLLLHPWAATSSILTSALGEVCKGVDCGKGHCKPASNSTFFFVCECDIGWKQTRSDKDDDFKFLPCVIPNCTLDFSCTEPTSPVQDKENRANTSLFDPCHWSDCGGGTCNETSPVTYTCQCKEGYYNLLKIGSFPCFQDCALGMDCAALGITVMNNSSPTPPPSMTDSSTNQASLLHGDIIWLISITMILAPAILKLN